MAQVLTDALIRAAKPPASGRLELADVREPGLSFRVTANGKRSWSFRFRRPAGGAGPAGFVRVTIGSYPAITLEAARRAAHGMRAQVERGELPATPKREARARAAAGSMGAAAARYLAEYAERHKRSHAIDARFLRLHILPAVTGDDPRPWRDRPLASIRRADVIEMLEGIVAAGKGTLANRVQSVLSGMFGFAIDAALTETNPCHRLRKRGVETPRTRVLSDDEIRLFWHGIVEPAGVRQTGLAMRLQLTTGARPGEAAGICRAELRDIGDPLRAAWIIPGSRTKNGRDHLIPLSPLARATVLDLLDLIEPGQPFLLPTRSRRRTGSMLGNVLTHAMVRFGRRLGDTDAARTWRAEPPTPHDLRRTVGTRLAELRIAKEIRDRCLNHLPGDVGSRHYNLHDYTDEKRDAFGRWSAALAAIINPAAVVSLHDERERRAMTSE